MEVKLSIGSEFTSKDAKWKYVIFDEDDLNFHVKDLARGYDSWMSKESVQKYIQQGYGIIVGKAPQNLKSRLDSIED